MNGFRPEAYPGNVFEESRDHPRMQAITLKFHEDSCAESRRNSAVGGLEHGS